MVSCRRPVNRALRISSPVPRSKRACENSGFSQVLDVRSQKLRALRWKPPTLDERLHSVMRGEDYQEAICELNSRDCPPALLHSDIDGETNIHAEEIYLLSGVAVIQKQNVSVQFCWKSILGSHAMMSGIHSLFRFMALLLFEVFLFRKIKNISTGTVF